jgi:hypothetical protein
MRLEVLVVQKRGQAFLEGVSGKKLIENEKDAVELVGLCIENNATRILLHSDNLPAAFFDLKSGLAGMILQKLANYQMKAAVVLPMNPSKGRFGDFVAETNRGKTFRVFQDRNEAERWLLDD